MVSGFQVLESSGRDRVAWLGRLCADDEANPFSGDPTSRWNRAFLALFAVTRKSARRVVPESDHGGYGFTDLLFGIDWSC